MKHRAIRSQIDFISAVIVFFLVIFSIYSCNKRTNADANIDSVKIAAGSSTIVYTDVKPDSVILKLQTDSFKLDLNNDGVTDFEFDRSRTVLCRDAMGAVAYAINLFLKPARGNNAIITSRSSIVPPLDSSAAIAPASLWASTSQVLLYGATSASGHCRSSLPARIGWLNVVDKYIGLKFSKDNNTYYGWARLSSSYSLNPDAYIHLISSGQLIVKDYAYNSSPNKAILAGQTR